MWSELIQPGAWPGLARRAPRPAVEECSVLSGPRGAESDSRGGEGVRERCKMLLSSLAPPGKRDVASGVEGGRGVPPRVCRGEWLPILATSPELSHGAQ